MIAKALICYALSVVLAVAAVVALCFYFKKANIRLSFAHLAIGTLSFIAVIAGMLFLIIFAFSEESVTYMKEIMSEAFYKIAVAVLFFAAICVIRYFVLNALYFQKERESKGSSFLAGYGLGGVLIIAVYCLFSFIYVGLTALSTEFLTLSSESVLHFKDSTVISVFTPFESHIFVTLVFVVYTALMLITAQFMTQHANLPYKWKHTLVMYLLTTFCEICMTCIFLFAVSRINYIAIIIIALVLMALAGVSVKLLYKYKEVLPYDKQFE